MARELRELKALKGKKREHDFTITASRVTREAIEQIHGKPDQRELPISEDKNPHAVALGRLGGLKGGRARTAKLTVERRREIAQKAARTRWQKNA